MTTESNESDENAPIRPCCQQRHYGPVCPDGLVMCCHCFRRVPEVDLHVLEPGDGSDVDSAPIREDVCRTCKKREQRWGRRGGSMTTESNDYDRTVEVLHPLIEGTGRLGHGGYCRWQAHSLCPAYHQAMIAADDLRAHGLLPTSPGLTANEETE